MKRVFAHIGFSVAITLLAVNLISAKYILIIAAGLAVLFIASLVFSAFRQALVVPICLGSALFACLVFLCVYNGTVIPQQTLNYQTAQSSFYIVDFPEETDNGYIYTVKTTSIGFDGSPQNIKLRVKCDEEINADSYQIINAKLKFAKIGDTAVSSYGYWSKNIFLTATANYCNVTDNYVFSPFHYLLNIRYDIIQTLTNLINGDSGALAAALLTGYRNALSDEAINSFKLAGCTHLTAVSGLHLTVITGVFLFVLKKLRVNDKANVIITLLIILLYSGIAGFSKSVVRAGIMMAVMIMGNLFNRRSDSLNSLGIAVFIICLNPFAVYDVGAMLSVLSVLSLITLYPNLLKLLPKNSHTKKDNPFFINAANNIFIKIAQGFLIALSICIYTMPVMYVFFGYVSIISLVSNIILVPLGSVAMVLSLMTYVFAKINLFTSVFAFITANVNRLILFLVKIFASFKHSTVSFGDYFGLVLAGVLIIFAFCFILKNRSLLKITAVISALLVAGSVPVSSVFYNDKAHIFVSENSASVITYDNKTIVYGINNLSDYYSVYNYLMTNRYDIDVIISNSSNYDYSMKLCDNFDCDTFVAYSFDDKLLQQAHCNNLIVCNEYSNSFSDDFNVKFKIENNSMYLLSNIIDTSLFISSDLTSNCDIIVSDNIKDSNGIIVLSDGNIIYTVSQNNAFSARRVDAWQG